MMLISTKLKTMVTSGKGEKERNQRKVHSNNKKSEKERDCRMVLEHFISLKLKKPSEANINRDGFKESIKLFFILFYVCAIVHNKIK